MNRVRAVPDHGDVTQPAARFDRAFEHRVGPARTARTANEGLHQRRLGARADPEHVARVRGTRLAAQEVNDEDRPIEFHAGRQVEQHAVARHRGVERGEPFLPGPVPFGQPGAQYGVRVAAPVSEMCRKHVEPRPGGQRPVRRKSGFVAAVDEDDALGIERPERPGERADRFAVDPPRETGEVQPFEPAEVGVTPAFVAPVRQAGRSEARHRRFPEPGDFGIAVPRQLSARRRESPAESLCVDGSHDPVSLRRSPSRRRRRHSPAPRARVRARHRRTSRSCPRRAHGPGPARCSRAGAGSG